MKLEKNNLFATPENQEEIVDRIESFPVNERAHAYMICMLTWNYAVKCSEEQENDDG